MNDNLWMIINDEFWKIVNGEETEGFDAIEILLKKMTWNIKIVSIWNIHSLDDIN